MFELRGDGRSPEELRTMVEWQIGPKLRQVPGVIESSASAARSSSTASRSIPSASPRRRLDSSR